MLSHGLLPEGISGISWDQFYVILLVTFLVSHDFKYSKVLIAEELPNQQQLNIKTNITTNINVLIKTEGV